MHRAAYGPGLAIVFPMCTTGPRVLDHSASLLYACARPDAAAEDKPKSTSFYSVCNDSSRSILQQSVGLEGSAMRGTCSAVMVSETYKLAVLQQALAVQHEQCEVRLLPDHVASSDRLPPHACVLRANVHVHHCGILHIHRAGFVRDTTRAGISVSGTCGTSWGYITCSGIHVCHIN